MEKIQEKEMVIPISGRGCPRKAFSGLQRAKEATYQSASKTFFPILTGTGRSRSKSNMVSKIFVHPISIEKAVEGRRHFQIQLKQIENGWTEVISIIHNSNYE